MVESTIREEFATSREVNERIRQTLDLERQKLEREQARLLQAHYADAIPLDLLKREQDRIGTSLLHITKQAASLTESEEVIERILTLALDLVSDCARAYKLAEDQVKRMFNQVFFEQVLIFNDDDIRAELAEPIASITSQSLRHHVAPRNATNKKSGTSPKGRTAQNNIMARQMATDHQPWIVSRKQTLVPLEVSGFTT